MLSNVVNKNKFVLASLVRFSLTLSVAIEHSFCATFLENVYYYAGPHKKIKKKLVLDKSVIPDQCVHISRC